MNHQSSMLQHGSQPLTKHFSNIYYKEIESSDYQIPISLKPNVVELRYIKLFIRTDSLSSKYQKAYTRRLLRYRD